MRHSEKASAIQDLYSPKLPARGLITICTYIHFGKYPHKQLGEIADLDPDEALQLMNSWPRHQLDNIVKCLCDRIEGIQPGEPDGEGV